MKKSVSLVLLIVMVVLSFGTFASHAQSVELIYWDTMNDQERPVMQGLIDTCADELGFEVVYEYQPFDTAQNTFKAAAQAGNAPDIMRTEVAWGPEFAALGYLADLSDYVTENEIATYLDAPFKYNTWNGGVWGLPQVTDAPALMYNKRLFEAAGLEGPPTTMDELREYALALSELDGVYGMTMLWGAYPMQAFIWAFGGGLIDEETLEISINNAGAVEAYEFVLGLMADGAMNPNLDPSNQYGNSLNDFKEGRAGMYINGPWASSDVLSGPEFVDDPSNLGVTAIPAGPAGQGSPVGGHEYAIYSGSPFIEESLELVRCLNRPENQLVLATDLNLIPTVRATYEFEELAGNEILQGFLAQMEVATNRPVMPAGGGIYSEFDPQHAAIILGARSPQDALNIIANAWSVLLEEQPE